MKHRALTGSEQTHIDDTLEALIDAGESNITGKLTDFIRQSFKFSKQRAFEIAAGYVIAKDRQARMKIARQLHEACAASFPAMTIPALRFFVLLQSPPDADEQPLESPDEALLYVQAMRLCTRWLLSRQRAFARHPECETLPELEAALKADHPECGTAGQLQTAIERDNE